MSVPPDTRRWPNSRLSGDDDGELQMAIAADPRKGVVRVTFEKPVQWMAMLPGDARKLAKALLDNAAKLEGAE